MKMNISKKGYEDTLIRLVEETMKPFPFLHEELLRLYNLGLNDRYMSIKIRRKYPGIHFTQNKILGWRRLNRLPANNTTGSICKIDETVEKSFLDLYNKGLNDLEIGIMIGINPDKITAWRIRNNLKANRKRKRETVLLNITKDIDEADMKNISSI